MFQYITRSDGKHIIVGEAASAHHAWVVGALESVVRGVFQFAFRHSGEDSACDRIARCYALPEHDKDRRELLPEPFGPLPYEYDRAKDVEYMDENKLSPSQIHDIVGDVRAVKSSPNGDLARSQVLFEIERQIQGTTKVDGEKITDFALKLILQAQFYRENPGAAVA